jgi:predicted RecB family nuclease
MKTLTKRINQQSLRKEKQAATTIVEYDDRKVTRNVYPDRIVSPPRPSPCCASSMEQTGNVEDDGSWLFIYKRCRTCGYTVRHFLMMSPRALQALRADLLRSMEIGHGRN